MKCLVTGGAGFIGSHLCELLLDEGHKVIAIDCLVSGREENIESLKGKEGFSFFKKDIRQESDLNGLFGGVDWVFHLSAIADIVPAIEHPKKYYEMNVTGTLNVLEAAKRAEVKRFIYTASCSCYGQAKSFPISESAPIQLEHPYALTKYLGEEMVMHWHKVYKMPTLSLRLFNVYGPRSRTNGSYGAVFGVFLAQKLHQKPLTIVGDGNQSRDFVFVKDVARAYLKAAGSDRAGEIYNVGSGASTTINHVAELIGGERAYVPKRPGEPGRTQADITKIKEHLQWSPEVTIDKGVEEILKNIDYWREAPLWDPQSIEKATESWFKHLG